MLLTGTYLRSLDEKQRMSLPKPIREVLGPSEDQTPVLYLAPGTDGSVALYPEVSFTEMAARLNSDSPNGLEVRAFSRLFYSQAQRVEADRQGRVRIPQELAQFAGLEKELVLVGVRDHLELWNRERWDTYVKAQQGRYDEIAERAFSQRSSTRTT
ncbi:MAG: division/cell wall cluster transcriptional repressor MraZ [Planctomycetes bacterium]|nr:division/cell wall cluster transcriptional repressor MraZ [Planctomycetota bacterium]